MLIDDDLPLTMVDFVECKQELSMILFTRANTLRYLQLLL